MNKKAQGNITPKTALKWIGVGVILLGSIWLIITLLYQNWDMLLFSGGVFILGVIILKIASSKKF